jgi:hypothetical protein
MLTRRRDKLDLVNKRLNEFYGPLYVASEAGNIAYRSLLQKQGKSQSFPILDDEMKEWVLWMTTIFMPLNDIREKIIIEKAYLIIEEQMPTCLLGRRWLRRAPFHHRLASRVRRLRQAILCRPQSRADPVAAKRHLAHLSPLFPSLNARACQPRVKSPSASS